MIAAKAEMAQNINNPTTDIISIPAAGQHPLTANQLELQAVISAVKEVKDAITDLKTIINSLHHDQNMRLSQNNESILLNYLNLASQRISLFSDRLTALEARRKADVDATKIVREEAVRALEAAQNRLHTVWQRENTLVVDAEVLDLNMKMADEKTREAVALVRTVVKREELVTARERGVTNREEREALLKGVLNTCVDTIMEDVAPEEETQAAAAPANKDKNSAVQRKMPPTAAEDGLVAGREQGVVRSGEEQALAELNFGADAAMEDAADAAAAAARWNGHPIRPGSVLIPPVGDPNREPTLMRWWRGELIALKEERLWQREVIVSSREGQLLAREAEFLEGDAALVNREQYLERMITTETRIAKYWRAQVVVAETLEALIATKGTGKEAQAMMWRLVRQARGLFRMGGGGEGKVEGEVEGEDEWEDVGEDVGEDDVEDKGED